MQIGCLVAKSFEFFTSNIDNGTCAARSMFCNCFKLIDNLNYAMVIRAVDTSGLGVSGLAASV